MSSVQQWHTCICPSQLSYNRAQCELHRCATLPQSYAPHNALPQVESNQQHPHDMRPKHLIQQC